ncbi:MAG: P-loop NTPase [Fibrobacteria bacterium]|nr:P-loop NTPase [Fibrobacteria bacterium]
MANQNKKIIAVTSGNGGTGKSFLTANLALELYKQGYHVVMADLAFSSAHLHHYLGLPYPQATVRQFINIPEVTLDKYLIDVSVGQNTDERLSSLKLLSSASDVYSYKMMAASERKRLYKAMSQLPYDFLLVDLPPGSSGLQQEVLSFSDTVLIVTDSSAVSLESAFLLIKKQIFYICSSLFKKNKEVLHFLDDAFNPQSGLNIDRVSEIVSAVQKLDKEIHQKIIKQLSFLNWVCICNHAEAQEGLQISEVFNNLIKKYLDQKISFWSTVRSSGYLSSSEKKKAPFLINAPDDPAAVDISAFAEALTGQL